MFYTEGVPSHASKRRRPTAVFDGPLIDVRDLTLWYGDVKALDSVSFEVRRNEILAFIGPSGCGKTTALKCLNRMHDDTRGVTITGQILMEGQDIYHPDIDPPLHRRRFGWVAQKPNPFPDTVFENVAYGARLHGLSTSADDLHALVEECLRRADIWHEVRDHLHKKAGTDLSGGQQQRLCIARALSTEPDILLMDEPTGSIDPIATDHIEGLMADLKTSHSLVIVTHSMMQARRISDRVAHFHMSQLTEIGPTDEIFDAPKDPRTHRFITGAVG